MTNEPIVIERTAGYFIGHWDRVILSFQFKSTDVSSFPACERAMQALTQRYPEPGGLLALTVLVDVRQAKMDQQTRDAAAALSKKYGSHIKQHALVILGSGIITSLLRSFVSALMLVTRQPTKTFNDSDATILWLRSVAPPDSALVRDHQALQKIAQALLSPAQGAAANA